MKLYIFLFTTFVLHSCHYIYYPTYPVVPIVETGEIGIQGTVGLTKSQLSGWYGFKNNAYVVGTFGAAYKTFGDIYNNTDYPYHSISGLVGAGYKIKQGSKIDLHLQGGGGIVKGYYYTSEFNFKYNNQIFTRKSYYVNTLSFRFYIQPILVINFNKNSSLNIIPRLNYESFAKVNASEVNQNTDSTQFKAINARVGELIVLYRIKSKVLNFDFYAGLTDDFSRNKKDIAQPIILGIGLSKTFDFRGN